LGRAASKKRKDQLRKQTYLRKQEIRHNENLALQTQLANDYILTHNMIARKTETYPLTEKVFTGTPENLKQILSSTLTGSDMLLINPSDYPEGLVL